MRRVLPALIFALIVISSLSLYAQEIPSESWMGVYFGQNKIGYAKFNIDKAAFEQKACYRLQSIMFTRLQVMGVDVRQNVETTMYLDESYEPIFQTFKMSSGGSSTSVNARFSKTGILAEMESQGSKISKTIPIPPGSKIIGDSTFLPYTTKLKVGDKIDVKTFNPLSLALEDDRMEVIRREDLHLGTDTVPAVVIKSTTPMGDVTAWQDEKGNLLKAIGLMGITMIREPMEVAQTTSKDVPDYDLAVATSAATATKIPHPRQVSYLKVRVTGLADKNLIIGDDRQKVTPTSDGRLSVVYEVSAKEACSSNVAELPINRPELDKFLEDGPYLQASNAEIVSAARQAVGKETNAHKAASLLRSWVNSNMEPKGEKGIVRSSLDVLHTKTGVCRDYAVLYTALARSVGIPTKMVVGLVYWNGRFYYHAWAESYVGEWNPVDPTLATDFVDATHIKLIEGDATSMFGMAKVIGPIGAEILDYKER